MKKIPSMIVIVASLAVLSLASCKTEPGESAGSAEKKAAVETPAATLTPKAGDDLKALAQAAPTDLPKAPDNVAAPPPEAEKTTSGLASMVLQKGTGTEHPKAEDVVRVNYTGWTTDGKSFDSSTKRGVPATFQLDKVIKGWTEGLQLMAKGEKTRFWIPVDLAYNNQPGRPAGMLVFDIELIDFH
jgi:FKBP-type peptidyl-prolyl cis-trans isomerase